MSCLNIFSKYTGTLNRIHTENCSTEVPFIDIAAKFAHLDGTVVLMSGGDNDCARYHILAVNPWLGLISHNAKNRVVLKGQSLEVAADPLEMVKQILGQYRLLGENLPGPVSAGLFGYISYDVKDFIEKIPKTTIDDLGLPQLCMYAPSAILIEDKRTGERRLHIAVREKGKQDSCDADRKDFWDQMQHPVPETGNFSTDSSGFQSTFSRSTYMTAVEKIKEYIISGHIYQVNLSQRFEGAFYGSSFAMFKTLFEMAPAPFYAYVNAGDHRIVSTSPERFLKQSGLMVETRPIKGTRPRGETGEKDRANAEELLGSKKDDAELSMIVDLMRNDLGRVCSGGSVKVMAHRRLEPYKNVFHLVSIIQGTLMDNKDSVDLLRAAFPGGSITGCPRIRAMEIIDEIEPCNRHIYTGSIGYISFHDTMDLSIAIRTATIRDDRILFSVGGGVVFDSDPSDEYDETLHKGRSITTLFENRVDRQKIPAVAWFNGGIVPVSDSRFCVTDKAVAYGYGFFETIRVNRNEPAYLEAHIERFNATWRALFNAPVPDLTWSEIILRVILGNRLENGLAAVKIMAACRDDEANKPFSSNIVVTARAATHRLDLLQKDGIDLAVYSSPRQTPLAGHKTLNYLYYYLAGKWAKKNGADEALILNPDGSISETNTANILCVRGRQVILPVSGHVLPGIMEQQVIRFLQGQGYQVQKQKIMQNELNDFAALMLTNSLMGAVPVLSIDGRPVNTDTGLCARINRHVL